MFRLIILLLTLIPVTGHAQLYKCEIDGDIYYKSKPCDGNSVAIFVPPLPERSISSATTASSNKNSNRKKITSSTYPSVSKAPTSRKISSWSAIKQMKLAFVGNYSEDYIRYKIEKAVDAYGMLNTNETHSRMGSALVVLRKRSGVSEMDLLNYALRFRKDTRGTNITFAKAVAFGAVELKVLRSSY